MELVLEVGGPSRHDFKNFDLCEKNRSEQNVKLDPQKNNMV